jgi:2-polyprenyl-6-methoxyphenol hydroxylase-like FAD-dependent oxidoreductase
VIGAGIGGLSAALTLARAGCRVRVFEVVPELKALGVGINLLPHSAKVLLELGLGEALKARSVLTGSLRYHAKDGKTIWSEPRGMDAGYPCPQYSIHRGELQMVLLAAVREAIGADRIVTGRGYLRAEQDDSGVTVTLGDPATGEVADTVRGDCLVGADGIMSAVRASFYPEEGNPVYAGQVLWRGVTEAEPFADGRTMVMIGNSARKAVIYPIRWLDDGRQLINWIAELAIEKELPANKGDWNRPGALADFIDAFRDWRFDWLDVPALFEGAEGCWEFPMVDRDPVPRWSFGRITLLGDAAHAMRPNGSNGASQGVLDAVALADSLAAEADVPRALARYEAARLEPTRALTLANRQTGPEIVLQMVEERCPNGFDDIHDHFSAAELQAIADSYKTVAGFSREQVSGRR